MKALYLAAALSALAAAPVFAGSTAHYTVTFDGAWSAATHPFEYPAGAHFSGLVGATHNGEYVIFDKGGAATAGLGRLPRSGGRGVRHRRPAPDGLGGGHDRAQSRLVRRRRQRLAAGERRVGRQEDGD